MLTGAALAAPPPRPAELDALLVRARVEGQVKAWCAGKFVSGRTGAYAVAAPSPGGGGRYLVLGVNEAPVVLAPYSGSADLACYSAGEAKGLNRSIAGSRSIQGRISPRWNTSVVCGFVENTNAVCWQYSPTSKAFVTVGEWVT